jgi:hypothetical protein
MVEFGAALVSVVALRNGLFVDSIADVFGAASNQDSL